MEELARVYARSLFEVALEQGKLDLLREQLGQFADALHEQRRLAAFFFSPEFSTEEKRAALAHLLPDADPTLVSFLGVLIDNHRMPVIFRVRSDFDGLWDEQRHQLPVEVTSAVALDEQTLRHLSEQIGQRTGQEVQLKATVDPDILGGLILRVGNSILDASIRNRLELLRKQVARSA